MRTSLKQFNSVHRRNEDLVEPLLAYIFIHAHLFVDVICSSYTEWTLILQGIAYVYLWITEHQQHKYMIILMFWKSNIRDYYLMSQKRNPARYDVLIMHLYRHKQHQHFYKHAEPSHVAAAAKHMVLFLLCKYEMEPEHNNSFIVSLYICSEHLRIPDCIINCQWNVPPSQSSALLTK